MDCAIPLPIILSSCRARGDGVSKDRNAARLRKAAGLTQEQLAERSGLSQQYISGLERDSANSAHPEEGEPVEGRLTKGRGDVP